MIINSLDIRSFKAIRNRIQYTFTEGNALFGTNETGKTTLAEAVCFCLYERCLDGSRNLDRLFNRASVEEYRTIPAGLEDRFEQYRDGKSDSYLNLLKAFRAEHGLYTDEPVLDVWADITGLNNTPLSIRRIRTMSGSSGTTRIMLNGEQVTHTELKGELPSRKLFFSIFVSGYYFTLSKEDQRSLLLDHVEDIDWHSMISPAVLDIIGYDQAERRNPVDVRTAMRTAHMKAVHGRNHLQFRKTELEEKIVGMKEGIQDVLIQPLEQELLSAEKETETLRTHHNILIHNQNVEETKAQIVTALQANDAISRLRSNIGEKIASLTREPPIDTSKSILQQAASVVIPELTQPIEPTGIDVPLLSTPILEGLDKCPECGTDLTAYVKQRADVASKENARLKVEAANKLKQARKEWKDTLTEAAKDYLERYGKPIRERQDLIQQANEATDQYKHEWDTWKRDQEQIAELRHKLNTLGHVPMPVVPELLSVPEETGSITLEETTDLLEKKQQEMTDIKARLTKMTYESGYMDARKKALADMEQELTDLPQALSTAEATLETVKTARMDSENLPGLVLSKQLEPVKNLLKDTEITLFKEVKKSGGFVPDILFSRSGVPYPMLSNSGQIKMYITVATMLNKLSDENIPLFIDNGEGLVSLPASVKNQQYFVAYVHRDHSILSITPI